MEAWATQQGLDEEYRQKLATLMGVQQPAAPMAADAGAMVGGMDPNAINPYAPQPMDMYAQTPPQFAANPDVSDATSVWSPSNIMKQAGELITGSSTPTGIPEIDLLTGAHPSMQRQRAQVDAMKSGNSETVQGVGDNFVPNVAQPVPAQPVGASATAGAKVSELDKARAAAAGVVDQNAIPALEKWKGGAASGAAASGMLKGLVGNVQEAQKGLKDAYKNVETAEVAAMQPAIGTNAAMAQNQKDIGALQNYEARLMEQRVQEFNAKKAEIDSSIKREQDRLMGMDPLDPKRAWNQASFGGKIGLAIGAMLSGFAGPEVLKQYTEQIFGKDFEAQKLAFEKQKGNVDMQTNRYAMLMNQLKDDAAVRAAYFAPIYKSLESKAGEIAAAGGSEQARANAAKVGAHFQLEGEKANTVTAQGMMTAAMKSVGSAMAAPAAGEGSKQKPYVLNEKMKLDQERISKKLVKTTLGIFEAPNEANRKQFEDTLNGGSKLIDAIEFARTLAQNTAGYEGVGKKLSTEDYARFDAAIKSITGAYSKGQGLGSLDRNLQELVASITGDTFNIGRARVLLNDMGNTTRRNVSSYVKENTLRPLHPAYARDPMYGNSVTQVWVPGGYSQAALAPLDISAPQVQGPGE